MDSGISITDYLNQKGIVYRTVGNELITKCIFNGCDNDSRPNEAHLYINLEKGQYHCKKCGEGGHIFTLIKQLGDDFRELLKNQATQQYLPAARPDIDLTSIVDKCHKTLPDNIRQYLNQRGIDDYLIKLYQLGYGEFYGRKWITIPITDATGKVAILKLRRDPADTTNPDKMKVYPSGVQHQLYGWDSIENSDEEIVICEGEFDRLVLVGRGIPAVTSTGGAGTFKLDWLSHFAKFKKVYICYDNDQPGRDGAERLTVMLKDHLPDVQLFTIPFPERMTEGKDVTDYFINYQGTPDEFMYQLPQQVGGAKVIDVSKFQPLSSKQLLEIIGLTIKQDQNNKLITFLCCLSAYTENAQFNISFNAPSSSGKSYIPIEISSLFPAEDVIKLGGCSPSAFFHEQGEYDKEKREMRIKLAHKILIFKEQPTTALLERLRSLLSHDEKEMRSKITDKSDKGGHRTKTVVIEGYPSVVFCTAGLRMDDQESTRFIVLSPEVTQEKIRAGIMEKLKKETDTAAYFAALESNPERKLLKERIEAIKQVNITEIRIGNAEKLEAEYLKRIKTFKPRHQRDIGRLLSLVKVNALLNLWWRERDGQAIITNEQDIAEAFAIWDQISFSQDFNIPPYLCKLYEELFIPAWKEKKETMPVLSGMDDRPCLSRQEIQKKYMEVYGQLLNDWQLRSQILPTLENAGLVSQEASDNDKRKLLVYPGEGLHAYIDRKNRESGWGIEQNNSEQEWGLEEDAQHYDELDPNMQSLIDSYQEDSSEEEEGG